MALKPGEALRTSVGLFGPQTRRGLEKTAAFLGLDIVITETVDLPAYLIRPDRPGKPAIRVEVPKGHDGSFISAYFALQSTKPQS